MQMNFKHLYTIATFTYSYIFNYFTPKCSYVDHLGITVENVVAIYWAVTELLDFKLATYISNFQTNLSSIASYYVKSAFLCTYITLVTLLIS